MDADGNFLSEKEQRESQSQPADADDESKAACQPKEMDGVAKGSTDQAFEEVDDEVDRALRLGAHAFTSARSICVYLLHRSTSMPHSHQSQPYEMSQPEAGQDFVHRRRRDLEQEPDARRSRRRVTLTFTMRRSRRVGVRVGFE